MDNTSLLCQINELFEKTFGLSTINTAKYKNAVEFMFNTNDERVKIYTFGEKSKAGKIGEIMIAITVEAPGRPQTYFQLGDCLHQDLERFPEYKFHHELRAKVSASGARLCLKEDVLAYAKELVEKL